MRRLRLQNERPFAMYVRPSIVYALIAAVSLPAAVPVAKVTWELHLARSNVEWVRNFTTRPDPALRAAGQLRWPHPSDAR
jgi:hypothetical protein